ncbi:MAG: arylsulfatase, partial [Planctomycetota bacterium]|nr:arylsulfatase [Planctomycetota bacterium]
PLLFNVVTDVGSKSDVADENPKIVERLTRFAEKAREDLGDHGRRGKNQRHRGKVDEPQPQLMSAN